MGDPTAEWQNHKNQTLGNAPLSLGDSLYLPWPNGKAIMLKVILTNSKLLFLALPKPTAGQGSIDYSQRDYVLF